MRDQKIICSPDGQWSAYSFMSIENPVVVNNPVKGSVLLIGATYENQRAYIIGKTISNKMLFQCEVDDFFKENCNYLSYADVEEITKTFAELQGFMAANKDIRSKTDDVDYCCQIVQCSYCDALSFWTDRKTNDFREMIDSYLDTCISTRKMFTKENDQDPDLTIDEEDFEK